MPFYKPWMDNINPQLILRFWRHKKSPEKLTISIYGVKITYKRTPFGELRFRFIKPLLIDTKGANQCL